MLSKISIITVCYQSANTLSQTIQSVKAQLYPHKEYILIDGGSSDHTHDIISAHQSDIDYWVSESDYGIYDAMNKGIKKAQGEIVGLLNADDLYAHPHVLSKVAQVFEDSSIQACYGDLVYFASDNPDKIKRYWKSSPFKPGLFAKGWSPPHPTFFVRKSVYQQYGMFNLTYKMGNDVELMMRLLEKHHLKTQYIPEVLIKMRLGGVSNQSLKHILLQNKEVLRAAKELQITCSPFSFILHKSINRCLQKISLPQRSNIHDV